MKIYSVRFRKRIQSDPELNFKEIYFVPTVAIGRCDEIDDTFGITNDGYRLLHRYCMAHSVICH